MDTNLGALSVQSLHILGRFTQDVQRRIPAYKVKYTFVSNSEWKVMSKQL